MGHARHIGARMVVFGAAMGMAAVVALGCSILFSVSEFSDTTGQPTADAGGTETLDAPGTEASDSGCSNHLNTDNRNCGTCGKSCLGGACSDGRCQPVVLASNQRQPVGVAIDEAEHLLYWVNSVQGGEVMRIDLATGKTTPVAVGDPGGDSSTDGAAPYEAGVSAPFGIAVDDTAVYWAEHAPTSCPPTPDAGPDAGGECDGHVWKLDKVDIGTGKSPEARVWSEHSNGVIALWSTDIYYGGYLRVAKVPKQGPSDQTTLAKTNGTGGIAVDSQGAVYFTDVLSGNVSQIPLGGVAEPVATGQKGPFGIALGVLNVYWTNYTCVSSCLGQSHPHSVMTTSRFGSDTPKVVYHDSAAPLGIVVWGKFVYWTDQAGGEVLRVPIAGGTPEVIARDQKDPFAITVDQDGVVYWSNFAGNSGATSGEIVAWVPPE